MSQFNPAIPPSLNNGTLASRILSNPVGAIGGGGNVPTWSQLNSHLIGLKHRIFELSQNATAAYQAIVNSGVEFPAANSTCKEANILINRFLINSNTAVDVINEISLRYNPNYTGAARDATESQNIILYSSEATEVFTAFLTENTLTVQRLQEIHSLFTLTVRRQERDALNVNIVTDVTPIPVTTAN